MPSRSPLRKVITVAILLVPFATLALEWANTGLFARLISPSIPRLELVKWFPKLSRDLDAIAYHHFHYPPDPYLYWFAITLIVMTGLAFAVMPIAFGEMTRDGWRSAPNNPRTEEIVNSGWKQLAVLLGLLTFILWPWLGLSFLDPGRQSFPPGLIHDLFMALFLAMYGLALACGPALVKFVLVRRAERF